MSRLRRTHIALALSAAVATATFGVVSSASGVTVRAGNLILNLTGDALPRKLPAKQFAPIKLKANGAIRTADGSHPPAGRSAFFEFDRNGRVFTRGLPTCNPRALENRTTQQALRACRAALVGRGQGTAQVQFPDQAAFTAQGPMLLFNGPPKGRRPTIYVHVYVAIPAPTAIVIPGVINPNYRGGGRRYGTSVLFTVPRIAGGFGSIIKFVTTTQRHFGFRGRKRSYLYARCSDGRFQARAKINFANGDSIQGTVVRPCQKRAVRRARR